MPTKLYVGNLSHSVTAEDLQTLFSGAGTVKSVEIVTDKFSGQSRGFGFVEMDEFDAKAITGLNGSEVKGTNILVQGALPGNPTIPRKRRRNG
jgi:RNA recognition motif-containing protein